MHIRSVHFYFVSNVDCTPAGLLYKNSLDCLRKTIELEGLGGLYKGIVPCWLRMAPWFVNRIIH